MSPVEVDALEPLGVEDPERDPRGVTDRVAERAGDRVGFREAVALAFVCLEPRFGVVWASADVETPSRASVVGSEF